jgi:hypothetical protein
MTKDIVGKNKKEYGEEYNSHLLDQYKLYIESVEKVGDRRQGLINHFLAINAALLSAIGLSFQI